MTHDEMIAVIQAHKEGKTIQCKLKDKSYEDDWSDCIIGNDYVFDFCDLDFRIKPESQSYPTENADTVAKDVAEAIERLGKSGLLQKILQNKF